MRLRDLFKKFRLALPVFGILLGSCSGSLNLPTMNRKNALPDGASYFTDGMVIGSMYIGNPSSASSYGLVLRFTNLATSSATDIYGSGTNSNLYPGFYSYPRSWINSNVTNTEDVVSSYGFGAIPASIDTSNRNVTFYFTDPVRVDIISQEGYDAIRDSWYVPAGDLVSDAYGYGASAGYSNGYADGNSVGYSDGYDDGRSVGYDSGYSVGYSDGFNNGYANASNIPTVITLKVPSDTSYNWRVYLVGTGYGYDGTTVYLNSSTNTYSFTAYANSSGWLTFQCFPQNVSTGYLRIDYADSSGSAFPLTDDYKAYRYPETEEGFLGIFMPYWVSSIDLTFAYTTTETSWLVSDYDALFVYSRESEDFELIKVGLSSSFYDTGYENGFADGQSAGYDSGYYDMSVIADSEIAQTSTQAYNDGRASVGTEETAITNLLGSLVSVPISVLNGLMPLAIWSTPIISILVTLMVVALVLWLVRVLI